MSRGNLSFKSLALIVGAMIWTLCLSNGAIAQGNGTINAGTTITVRTNDVIDADYSTGETFRGVVTRNVVTRDGDVAVPRGAEVEMVVTQTSRNSFALELNGLNINGQHFNVSGGDAVVSSGRRQITTQGRNIYVPANTTLTFDLQRPLRLANGDETRRYKPGYGADESSRAFQAGIAAGRADAQRNLQRDARSNRWTSIDDRRDYEAGYNRGYDRAGENNAAGNRGAAWIRIARNNDVTWQAPVDARVFVQVDNNPLQLFGAAPSGSQNANWIGPGHVYVFIMRDLGGNELARERLDLRR